MSMLYNYRVLVLGSQQIAMDVIEFVRSISFCGGNGDGYVFPGLVGVIASDVDKDKELYGKTVAEYCFEEGIPCLSDKINANIIKKINPDIIFSIYYRKMISKDIINIPRMGCVNLHPSFLPFDRGPAPVYWAVRNGNSITGTTLHYVDEGMDTGDIIDRVKIKVGNMTGFELNKELMREGLLLFKKNYCDIMCGRNNRMPQHNTCDWPSCNIMYDNNMRYIDWSRSAEEIYNHIRAHARPYSGSIARHKDHEIVLWRAEIMNEYRNEKGPGYFETMGDKLIIQTRTKPIMIKEYVCEYGVPHRGRFK